MWNGFRVIDRRTADKDLTVGCGYYALGCVLNIDPRSLKEYARSELGILRPRGLSWDEIELLAHVAGFKAIYVPGDDLTVSQWLKRVAGPGERAVLGSHKHWIGVHGKAIYDQRRDGSKPMRMRVRHTIFIR